MCNEVKKIIFVDFWQNDGSHSVLLTALQSMYRVEICESILDADYVIYSIFGNEHLQAKQSSVKIFYTGENIVPDFNLCDYAIGFDYLDFGDRYLRYQDYDKRVDRKHIIDNPEQLLKTKKGFCSFTVSNGNGSELRTQMFHLLSTYKKVDSGGRYLNNVGGRVSDKFQFDYTHKFSICFENDEHPGYTTEKLPEAFAAQTIPIYWGDPLVGRVFNTRSFINVRDFDNFDDVLKRVIEIDNDDQLYLSILQTPAYISDEYSYDSQYNRLCTFYKRIFDQPIDLAIRRNTKMKGRRYLDSLIIGDFATKHPLKFYIQSIANKIKYKIHNL